jgi:carbon-monoxide dehydrogenase small subunit
MLHSIKVKVNGVDYKSEIEPRMILTDFIRNVAGLTGTHIGCLEGECGACTIILNGEAVNSCTMFAIQADGKEILTVEGLEKDGKLHPLQEAFWESHALQCGFCTPGLLMMSYALLKENPDPTDEEIRVGISGNLCRCTGYINIIKAIKAAAMKMGVEA